MEGSLNNVFDPRSIELNLKAIKAIFIILITYYTNFRVNNRKYRIDVKKTFMIIVLAVICGIIKYKSNYLISLMASILAITFIDSSDDVKNGMLITITSMTINYIISFITVIINFVFAITFNITNNYINLIMIISSHIVLLMMFFKIKKFRYGFGFLQRNKKDEYIDLLILNVSIIILFSTIVFVNSNIIGGLNVAVGIITFSITMLLTVYKSIQLYYKQKLFEKELNETKSKLEEKEKEVKELEAENLKISKNSHTLSHKQKSLEYKIEQMMTRVEISTEEAAEVRDRVKEIKKDLYKEKSTIKLDKTGIALIDDMLEYMQSECKKNKIDFELQIKGNIHYMINNLITKEDLETLLADHIKNAIIAINHTDNINRSILVRLGEIDGIYSLYIYDSGIEFEKETLENLGKKPSTTHANEGGTGMGFMNTFDTLRECEASLIINELNEPSKENYTKAIIIKFDKKNEFKIISYR